MIDPDELDCTAYFPSAFTPNGDGINDVFRILNRISINFILEFEIYDKWGDRIFYTQEIEEGWDGSIFDTPAPPGAYFYRCRYICDAEVEIAEGTVTLIR